MDDRAEIERERERVNGRDEGEILGRPCGSLWNADISWGLKQ